MTDQALIALPGAAGRQMQARAEVGPPQRAVPETTAAPEVQLAPAARAAMVA